MLAHFNTILPDTIKQVLLLSAFSRCINRPSEVRILPKTTELVQSELQLETRSLAPDQGSVLGFLGSFGCRSWDLVSCSVLFPLCEQCGSLTYSRKLKPRNLPHYLNKSPWFQLLWLSPGKQCGMVGLKLEISGPCLMVFSHLQWTLLANTQLTITPHHSTHP